MEILIEDVAGAGLLRVQGELTIYSAADMKIRLLTALAQTESLEVDLGEVTEMDTAGVQLLILLKREAQQQGKRLVLSGHSPAVMALIELYNLAGWFGDPLVFPAASA